MRKTLNSMIIFNFVIFWNLVFAALTISAILLCALLSRSIPLYAQSSIACQHSHLQSRTPLCSFKTSSTLTASLSWTTRLGGHHLSWCCKASRTRSRRERLPTRLVQFSLQSLTSISKCSYLHFASICLCKRTAPALPMFCPSSRWCFRHGIAFKLQATTSVWAIFSLPPSPRSSPTRWRHPCTLSALFLMCLSLDTGRNDRTFKICFSLLPLM